MDYRLFSQNNCFETYIWSVELVVVACLINGHMLRSIDRHRHDRVLLDAKRSIMIVVRTKSACTWPTFVCCYCLVRVELEVIRILMMARFSINFALQLGQILFFLGHVRWFVDCWLFGNQRHLVKFLLSRHLVSVSLNWSEVWASFMTIYQSLDS